MARKQTAVATRQKERDAIALHLEDHTFDEIAERTGYADRSGAYGAVMRALKRETAEDVAEVRTVELARLDAMTKALWPKVLAGDVPATTTALRVMERRARYLGLDFSDGLEERQMVINEAVAVQFLAVMEAAFTAGDLTLEQRRAMAGVMAVEVQKLNAVETTTT